MAALNAPSPSGIALLLSLYRHHANAATSWGLCFALSTSLLSAVLLALAPVQLKALIDGAQSSALPQRSIGLACSIVALIAGAKILGELKWLWLARAEQDLDVRLAGDLFERTLKLRPEGIADLGEGAFTQRFMSGLEGARLLVQQMSIAVLPACFEIIAVATIVATHAPAGIVGFVVGGALVAGLGYQLSALRVAPLVGEISRRRTEVANIAADGVSHIEAIKLARAEAHLRRRLDKALDASRKSWISLYNRRATDMSLAHLVFAVAFGLSFASAAASAASGAMSAGDLALTYACFLQLVRPLEGIGVGLRDAVEYGRRALDVAQLAAGPSEIENASNMPLEPCSRASAAAVHFRNVSIGTRQNPILTDVNFSIPARGFFVIAGASGAGKSTLVRLMTGLRTRREGEITIAGRRLDDISRANLRGLIGLVPQEPRILNASLGDNLMLANPNATTSEVTAALAAVELDAPHWHGGLDWPCGPSGARLSGGERQRLALARALLARPQILILDEATTGFDAPREARVLARVRAWMTEGALVLVTHRLANASAADLIFVLEDGQIVQQGSHSDLLRLNGRYRHLWNGQQAFASEANHECARI